jgi:hypothetical protein
LRDSSGQPGLVPNEWAELAREERVQYLLYGVRLVNSSRSKRIWKGS